MGSVVDSRAAPERLGSRDGRFIAALIIHVNPPHATLAALTAEGAPDRECLVDLFPPSHARSVNGFGCTVRTAHAGEYRPSRARASVDYRHHARAGRDDRFMRCHA